LHRLLNHVLRHSEFLAPKYRSGHPPRWPPQTAAAKNAPVAVTMLSKCFFDKLCFGCQRTVTLRLIRQIRVTSLARDVAVSTSRRTPSYTDSCDVIVGLRHSDVTWSRARCCKHQAHMHIQQFVYSLMQQIKAECDEKFVFANSIGYYYFKR